MSELKLDVDQAGEVKAALRREKGSDGSEWTNEKVKALTERRGLFGQVLDVLEGRAAIVPCGASIVNVAFEDLIISLDYGMSFAEMITQGRYDWTNSDITEERFPVKGIGKVERTVELIHFGYNISSEDAVKDLAKRGLRPATIEELLAFGAKYSDLQRKFLIVALGSSARVGDDRYVPYLCRHDAERGLNLGWWGGGWYGSFRFLAVRNK